MVSFNYPWVPSGSSARWQWTSGPPASRQRSARAVPSDFQHLRIRREKGEDECEIILHRTVMESRNCCAYCRNWYADVLRISQLANRQLVCNLRLRLYRSCSDSSNLRTQGLIDASQYACEEGSLSILSIILFRSFGFVLRAVRFVSYA